MQGFTHVLAGVVIQRSFADIGNRPLRMMLIAGAAYLSHGLLDRLARLTYHPSDPRFHDPFWVGYHLLAVVLFILFLWLFWRNHRTGIIFALLPDVDWIFIHGSSILGVTIRFYDRPHLHWLVHTVIDAVPLLGPALHSLPRYTESPLAALVEAGLAAGMLAYIRRSDLSSTRDAGAGRIGA